MKYKPYSYRKGGTTCSRFDAGEVDQNGDVYHVGENDRNQGGNKREINSSTMHFTISIYLAGFDVCGWDDMTCSTWGIINACCMLMTWEIDNYSLPLNNDEWL